MEQLFLKEKIDDFEVEFSTIQIEDEKSCRNEITEIDQLIDSFSDKIAGLNTEIDRLTNHADGFDYTIAVASGVLSGLVDSFFVGEIKWDEELKKTYEIFNKAVVKAAGQDPEAYSQMSEEEKQEYLEKAIRKLEKFKLPSDNVWNQSEGNSSSSAMLHHIDDLCHHPTPLGFLACLVSVLFKTAIIVDTHGRWHFHLAKTETKDTVLLWGVIAATALLRWIVYLAEKKYTEKQYEEMPKPIRVLLRALAYAPATSAALVVLYKWAGHLCSDIVGSSGSAGNGMGIPGLLLSALKELASLPPFSLIPGLHETLDGWFSNGFDARAEATLLRIAGKQMLPILLNEVLVRGFYFVSRLTAEAKQHGEDWEKYHWDKVLPWNKRTIVRMLTIASGTFVAVDVADSAIRTAISGEYCDAATFLAKMALRVNFVGIGRFSIAIYSDTKMGIQRSRRIAERIDLRAKMLRFYDAKVYYKQGEVWEAAENAELAVIQMTDTTNKAVAFWMESYAAIQNDINVMDSLAGGMDKHNPGLREELLRELL